MKQYVIVGTGTPVFVEDGVPNTSGILGKLSEENVYIKIYAAYQDKTATQLEVGERCPALFRLSGEKATYDVVRVS